MKLTVTHGDKIFQVDVYEDMELENLVAYCDAEIQKTNPYSTLQLYFNSELLTDMKKTLKQYKIADGDMLLAATKSMLTPSQNATQAPVSGQSLPIAAPSTSSVAGSGPMSKEVEDILNTKLVTTQEAARMRDEVLANPENLNAMKLRNMPLADACASSVEDFKTQLNQQIINNRDERLRKFKMLTADPFDVETQKMIAEEIQRQQIDNNMHDAFEFMPEAFGQVHMLYIKCKVNGTPIDAFVDSGAQSTVMSKACAERCNVTRLIDDRWAGVALGVGTQKILGRIHLCQIQIENDFLPSSLNVLEHQPMEMLLGLDMLKRHQCVIDLKTNILRIGTTGTETRFLYESELPEHAKQNH